MKNTVKIRITKMEYKRNCENKEELRRCIRLLEKRHKYDKPELSWYFKWGFGHNHFWVSDLNGVRLIFVEF